VSPTGPFLWTWVPSLVTVVCSGACAFTATWWLSTTPDGAQALAAAVAVGGLAALVVTAVAARFIDRSRKRVAILGLAVALTVLMAALAGPLSGSGRVAVALVGATYVVVVVVEMLYLAAVETASAAAAPATWPLARVAVLTQVHSQLDRIVAPVFAGALIAAGHATTVPLVAAAMMTAGLLALAVVGRRHLPEAVAPVAPDGPPTRAIRVVRNDPGLRYLLAFGALSNLVVFPFVTMLPVLFGRIVPVGPESAVWTARAVAAYGVGMLAGSVALAARRADLAGPTGLRAASAAFSLICGVVVAMAWQQRPEALVVGTGLTGLLFSVLVAAGGAHWLARTPPGVRAQVFGLKRLVAFSTIPLGTAVYGLLDPYVDHRWIPTLLAVTAGLLNLLLWRMSRPARTTSIASPLASAIT